MTATSDNLLQLSKSRCIINSWLKIKSTVHAIATTVFSGSCSDPCVTSSSTLELSLSKPCFARLLAKSLPFGTSPY